MSDLCGFKLKHLVTSYIFHKLAAGKGEIEQDEDSHRSIQNCRHMGRYIITAVDFYSHAAKIFCRYVFPSNHYGYDSRYSFSAISDCTCAFGSCEEVESFTLVHGIGSRLIAFRNICIRVLSSQERLEVRIAEKNNDNDSRRPTPDVIRTDRLLVSVQIFFLERVRTRYFTVPV